MSVLRVGTAVATAALMASCTRRDTGARFHTGTRPTSTATEPSTPTPTPAPEFDVKRVLDDIRYLAREVGPRHGTSDAYREAADWVEQRFTELGYTVDRQQVDVPAGTSWGVRVPAGRTPNIIASPPGFDDAADHRIVGAHLDTVPQAPGAEDNASGIAVMLELARLYAGSERPVRFIAFTAEEPRGAGDNRHHFGSRAYVNRLDAPRTRCDARDGVTRSRWSAQQGCPAVHWWSRHPARFVGQLGAAGRDADVPTSRCADNRASDHWSFERNDLPAARLGSIPYAAYHSARDLPRVVDRRQLERVGAIMTAWLQPDG